MARGPRHGVVATAAADPGCFGPGRRLRAARAVSRWRDRTAVGRYRSRSTRTRYFYYYYARSRFGFSPTFPWRMAGRSARFVVPAAGTNSAVFFSFFLFLFYLLLIIPMMIYPGDDESVSSSPPPPPTVSYVMTATTIRTRGSRRSRIPAVHDGGNDTNYYACRPLRTLIAVLLMSTTICFRPIPFRPARWTAAQLFLTDGIEKIENIREKRV